MALVNTLLVVAFCWLLVVEASYEKTFLTKHNQLRKKHGCPPLKLDDDLSSECEEYAKELAEKDEMTHSERAGHDYAENLCYRSRRHEKCVQEWYDEIKIYDFNNPVFKKKTAHFTALVWKETKKMGYGQAKSKRGITYVVVRYTPTGNMPGEFKENVPKPIKKRRSSPREVETNNSNLPQVHAILVLLTFFLLFKTRSKW